MTLQFTRGPEGLEIRMGAARLLSAITAQARLADGRVLTTPTTDGSFEREGEGARLVSQGTVAQPELSLTLRAIAGALLLRAALRNTTSDPLRVQTLTPLAAPESEALRGAFYRLGWQSWSPSGVTPMEHNRLPAGPPVVAPHLPEGEPDDLTSEWGALLGQPGGKGLLLGFTSAKRATAFVRIGGGQVRASCDFEGRSLAPGARLVSESLMLAAGADLDQLLRAYARAIAERMAARQHSQPLTGWCTWYQYFSAVNEAAVIENLERLRAEGWSRVIQVVQLDDGYEREFGDWLTCNEKFPHGLAWLAAQIRAAGFTPGLWLAPFMVSPESHLYQAHPDWVIRDGQDLPVQAWLDFDWEVERYGLDLTHPEVRQWMGHLFHTLVREWGFQYLKLDFLFAGALRGRRSDPHQTAVEAYRSGLELIRETVGETYLLGCGAPLLPSVGLVDGMRIGPDIAPFWAPDPQDRYRAWPSADNAVRNTLARYWMHGPLWQNDPDCVLIREQDTQLSQAEVQSWVTVVGLSGGLVVWSDALAEIEPGRAAMLQALLPPFGQAATPSDFLAAEKPQQLTQAIVRPFERWELVALFNWTDEDQSRRYQPPVPSHAFEFWTRRYYPPQQEALSLGIPAHGCRLLAVRPVQAAPQLVGSTFHLTQGGVELREVKWDPASGVLAVDLHPRGGQRGELTFSWPEGYHLESLGSGAEPRPVTNQARTLTVTLAPVTGCRLALRFGQGGEAG